MQASFRWNDNGGRNGFVVIPTAPSVIPAQAGIQWFSVVY